LTAKAVILAHRGVLSVAGADRASFLQGIVSNDVARVSAERALWAAFLTPQGKFLHEFFLAAQQDAFLLDCEADRAGDLARRLKLYKLRAQVILEPRDDLVVTALFGAGALDQLAQRIIIDDEQRRRHALRKVQWIGHIDKGLTRECMCRTRMQYVYCCITANTKDVQLGMGGSILAIDSVHAGVGDRVLLVQEGKAAMQAMGRGRAAVDAAIIGVINTVTLAE